MAENRISAPLSIWYTLAVTYLQHAGDVLVWNSIPVLREQRWTPLRDVLALYADQIRKRVQRQGSCRSSVEQSLQS